MSLKIKEVGEGWPRPADSMKSTKDANKMNMNKNFLELWGQTLLEMSKLTDFQGNFSDLFQGKFTRQERKQGDIPDQFIEMFQKMFGKEGIDGFNRMLKEFYDNAGVVPKTRFNELKEKYSELKRKIFDLEEEIERLKRKLQSGKETPSNLLDDWLDVANQYTEMNRKFFQEFKKYFDE